MADLSHQRCNGARNPRNRQALKPRCIRQAALKLTFYCLGGGMADKGKHLVARYGCLSLGAITRIRTHCCAHLRAHVHLFAGLSYRDLLPARRKQAGS